MEELSENEKKYNQLLNLADKAFAFYYSQSCQCAFPRYLQLTSINCSETGNSFRCYETELLISKSKQFFDIEESSYKDENVNEKWVCKKCHSIFEFGWSDFSIYVDRQKLELVELKVESIGKNIQTPIPLYLGLEGHSYPPKSEMIQIDYKEFEKYILES